MGGASSSSWAHARRRPLAERGGRVALGVEVDEHDGVAGLGEAVGEGDRGGCLADATLLVRDGGYHASLPSATQ